MKKFLAIIVLSLLWCTTISADGRTFYKGKNKMYIQQSSAEFIRIKYSNCIFCKNNAGVATRIAEDHCSQHNRRALFVYKRVGEFYDTDTFDCRGTLKAASFDEKKAEAKKKCISIGFKEGTSKMSDCILKLVAN